MTSTEKVRAFLEQARRPPGADATPHELALGSLAAAAPMLGFDPAAMLPSDPAELDELLEHGMRWLASLRSDGAREAVVYADA